jgi:signal transduction histidine kinase
MAWRMVSGVAGRYREVALAIVFLGMATYEAFEMWVLELPHGSGLSLGVAVHSLQVVAILMATYVFLRAWHEKTAHEEALTRMIETVVYAQEEERRRIAYEVHDGIAQLIVSAKQHLDTCTDVRADDGERGDTARVARELATAADRLDRAISETRRVLKALRPPALDSTGLVDALRKSLDEAGHEAGWSVTLTESLGDLRLPPAVEMAVFRIVQEGLANAARHARTGTVAVDLRRDEDWLMLDVRDDGVGFVAADERVRRRGLGLLSMRERARLLGGTCTIESAPDRGTRIAVRLPLRNGSANGRPA